MFRTKLAAIAVVLALLFVAGLGSPRANAAEREISAGHEAATTSTDLTCQFDVVLYTAHWTDGQGAAEGKLETRIIASKGSLFTSWSGTLGVNEAPLINQQLGTISVDSGSDQFFTADVVEFDSGSLGANDKGSKTGGTRVTCGQRHTLNLVVPVPGTTLFENQGSINVMILLMPR